jgi:RNA polymerase sigma factor (TIGR02999 family)
VSDVTQILNAIEQGDAGAVDKLLPLVYEELRGLAARMMVREKPGQTLQATALVHEAYIRLLGSDAQNWVGQTQFFSAAAEAMRRILIENARRKQRVKRGGEHQRVDLDVGDIAIDGVSDELLQLNDALNKLEATDRVKAELVKLRYFAGLTIDQSAKLLGLSRRTALRYWAYARAWLYDEINGGSSPES